MRKGTKEVPCFEQIDRLYCGQKINTDKNNLKAK